ncbi:MAG: M48 family metalloprotease [Candidatus Yanofskybacteria bacterium]|nr:M48 family metalloprotease [Candidatus Yanofskybacteria bacterium]
MSEDESGNDGGFGNLYRAREVIFFLVFVLLVVFFFIFLNQSEDQIPNKGSPGNLPSYAKLEKEIDLLVLEIRNSGALPPLKDDFEMDESVDLVSQDYNIVLEHEKTKQYLELILANLQKDFSEEWKNRVLKLRLYDDRFVGRTNNAFALPAETIYVGTTQIMWANNEAELAALLSHEVSHIALRHVAESRRIVKNLTVFAQKAFVAKDFEKVVLLGLAAQKLFGYNEFVGILPLEHESEADRNGQTMLRNSGYDDLALASSLERIEKIFNNNLFSQIVQKRIRDLKNNSKDKSDLNGRGKTFIVSKEEDLRLVQAALQQFLNDLALK